MLETEIKHLNCPSSLLPFFIGRFGPKIFFCDLLLLLLLLLRYHLDFLQGWDFEGIEVFLGVAIQVCHSRAETRGISGRDRNSGAVSGRGMLCSRGSQMR